MRVDGMNFVYVCSKYRVRLIVTQNQARRLARVTNVLNISRPKILISYYSYIPPNNGGTGCCISKTCTSCTHLEATDMSDHCARQTILAGLWTCGTTLNPGCHWIPWIFISSKGGQGLSSAVQCSSFLFLTTQATTTMNET